MAWQDLSDEAKQAEIVAALTLNESGIVEPQWVNAYIEAKAATTDLADKMRLDIQYFDLVFRLRREGKTSPLETLQAQAKEMIHLNDLDMRRIMSEKTGEFRRIHGL